MNNQYEGWSDEDKAAELDRLITEQAKDDKRNNVLPLRVGRKKYAYSTDPHIMDNLEEKGLHYDSYHGDIPDDI